MCDAGKMKRLTGAGASGCVEQTHRQKSEGSLTKTTLGKYLQILKDESSVKYEMFMSNSDYEYWGITAGKESVRQTV